MSYICDNCGKKTVHGHSQRHRRGIAGKRWLKRAQVTPRLFKPNLQKVAIMENGKKVQMKLCTKCIKRFKKDGKIPSYSSLKAALG
jgi:large subunit ribosomal protein L28